MVHTKRETLARMQVWYFAIEDFDSHSTYRSLYELDGLFHVTSYQK